MEKNAATQKNLENKQKVSLQATFSAFKHRNYRLWFAGQLVSLVGTWMQSTAQGYLAFELTHSVAFLGYVGFANGLPTWLFTLYGGLIADRIPRRTLLVVVQIVMMLLAAVIALLTFTGAIQPWHILVMAFLLGICNAFDSPARQAFVADLVDRKDLTNAIALNSMMFNGALVVGPAVAGITYAVAGPAWCFTLNALSFMAVIAALLLMKFSKGKIQTARGSIFTEIGDGIQYVLSRETVWMLIGSLGFIAIFGFGMVTLLPAWAVDILGGDVRTNGLLLSARGLGALIGALTVASLGQFGVRGRIWTMGSFLMPVILILFSLFRTVPFSVIGMIGMGWAFMAMANTANAMVQSQLDDRVRGRVMGIYTLVFMGGTPIGSLLVGTLAGWFNPPTAIIICAIILVIFAVSVFLLKPQIRRLH